MVQLGPQSWFALVGLAGTGLRVTEDVVQLSPHSGFALELRESGDSAWGFVLVGIVVPDVLTPFRPSYGREKGQIGMGWRGERWRKTHIQAEERESGRQERPKRWRREHPRREWKERLLRT